MQESDNPRHDLDDIRRSVRLIAGPAWDRGDVVELRALATQRGVVAGYFDADHQEELVKMAARLSGAAQGVYITLNPILRDCLARSANRPTPYAKNTTGDKEITHRHWLLIDTDPARPRGISANDEEHDLALRKATDIRAWLREQGWPDPIFADSGNGGHLLYRIDLPADDGGLLQRVLKTLQERFGDKAVAVDLTVHNPSRISKLYGTLACKGDSLPDRPHRIARLLEVPEQQIEVVSRDLLESVAGSAASVAGVKAVTQSNGSQRGSSGQDFNLVEYLQSHGVEVGKSKTFANDGTLWELKRCPWRPSESDGGPYVIQFANGNIDAGCRHSQCNGKGWNELRDVIHPGWREAEPKNGSGKGPSIAQQIVALGSGDELFHTNENEAFVTIRQGERRETWRVNGEDYRLILRRRLHEKGVIATKSALDDAIATLASKAVFDGPERSVHVRTAQHGGKIYIDLCNEEWEAVEISTEGWRVIADPPARFVRRAGMLPLPRPVTGGNVEQLRDLINVNHLDWPLVVAWLMAAIRPTGPYPILLVNGEQGSCKSTTCRRLRSLVDPNSVPLRDAPRNEQTLMIWAKNSHVIALDNLSGVTKDLSNALCRLSTGGGHSERTHYSNDGETLFYAVRPQMLNGIGDIATRSDFLDRALSISLPVVPRQNRKTEKELDEQFAQVHASILGALFTAASHGLKQLPEVEKLQLDLPRLADFANWIIAVEAALGWEAGTFIRAMNRNEDDANELAIASSPVAEAARRFVAEHGNYDGTWTDLLKALNDEADDATKRQENWPKNETWLSNRLRERSPNLRAVGIEVECFDKERPRRVTLTILQSERPQSMGGSAFGGRSSGRYYSEPALNCYGNDDGSYEAAVARLAMEKLIRFWSAPPLPSDSNVVIPSLSSQNSGGAQVIAE